MKSAMINHVERTSVTMFRQSTGVVGMSLGSMSLEVNNALLDLTEEIFQRVTRDYKTVLLGVSANSQAQMPRAERVLRLEMTEPLSVADAAFRPLVEDGQAEGVLPLDPGSGEEASSLEVKVEKDAGPVNVPSDAGEAEESTAQSEPPKIKLENGSEARVLGAADGSFAVGLGDPADEFMTTGFVKSEPVY